MTGIEPVDRPRQNCVMIIRDICEKDWQRDIEIAANKTADKIICKINENKDNTKGWLKVLIDAGQLIVYIMATALSVIMLYNQLHGKL